MNRLAFIRSGSLFVPALLLPRKSLGQFGSFNDQAFMAQSPASAPNGLLNNLSAFWPLNEVAAGNKADLSGNGLTLTDGDNNIVGTASGTPPSNIGTWADFTVADAAKRLSHASVASLQSGSGFSAMTWFQPKVGVPNAAVMGKWSGTIFEYVLWTNNNIQVNGMSNNGGNSNTVVGSVVLSAGTTYQLVFGFDGTNIWIQVNAGTRINTVVSNPPIDSKTAPFAIGNYSPTTNIPVNGYIGHCAFWKRNLLTADVTVLYNGGNPLPFAKWTT